MKSSSKAQEQTNGNIPSIAYPNTRIYHTYRGSVKITNNKVEYACIWLGKSSVEPNLNVKIVGKEFRIWNPNNPMEDYFSRKYPYEHGKNALPTETLLSVLCSDTSDSVAFVAVKRRLVELISKTFHKLDFSALWKYWRKPIVFDRTPIITKEESHK